MIGFSVRGEKPQGTIADVIDSAATRFCPYMWATEAAPLISAM